jgi:hypothetical protein
MLCYAIVHSLSLVPSVTSSKALLRRVPDYLTRSLEQSLVTGRGRNTKTYISEHPVSHQSYLTSLLKHFPFSKLRKCGGEGGDLKALER